jgi:hypothetical protein
VLVIGVLVFGLVTAAQVWRAGAAMSMKMSAKASGGEETPPNSSTATGTFQGTIASNMKTISYTLTFSKLSTKATAAHIHAGAKGVAGPVVVWFCGGGGRAACPANGGTVRGSINPANVLAGGDVKKGDLGSLIKAIEAGNTYVNVHSTKYPGGEIRGQIESGM